MTLALDLSGRVALVTGGTRGIGLGISDALRAAGAEVVTCARSSADESANHYVCDVRDPDAVTSMVSALVDRFGRLDIAVNNAGGAPYVMAAEASPRLHESIVSLNLLGAMFVAQAANAVMQGQETGGAIINISSVSAARPSPGAAAYGSAKAGLDAMSDALAMEWGPKVRVNAIDVGLCRTELTGDHVGDDLNVAAIEATVPLRRLAEPRDVGNIVAFLASDLASYVSGARIACHGGGEPPVFIYADKLSAPTAESQ